MILNQNYKQILKEKYKQKKRRGPSTIALLKSKIKRRNYRKERVTKPLTKKPVILEVYEKALKSKNIKE